MMNESTHGTPSPVAPAATDQPVVTLAGVAKRFANGTLALDGFDLSIRGGEFLALLAVRMRQIDRATADRGPCRAHRR
jgi:hypothetical protein